MAQAIKHDIPKNGAQTLITQLVAAKATETAAKKIRMDLEEKLSNHPSIKKHIVLEGTVNFAVKDGDAIKIVTKLNRRIDQDMVKSDHWSDLPVEVRETVFRWKAELQLTQFKALDKMDHKMANKVRKFFTTTSGRPTITIIS